LASPGLLAHALVSKYADHIPLYRQSEIFARQGVKTLNARRLGRQRGPVAGAAACAHIFASSHLTPQGDHLGNVG
jgi:transposase